MTHHAVFVGGFMNELTTQLDYFVDMRLLLKRKYKIKSSYIAPLSRNAINDNVQQIVDEILKLHTKYKIKLRLYGHSAGGALLLYLALTNAWLFDNVVEGIVLIQAAIKGSPLAKSEDNVGILYKICKKFVKQNLLGLSPEFMKDRFDDAFQKYNEYFKLKKGMDDNFDIDNRKKYISSRIFYIRSSIGSNDTEKLCKRLQFILFTINDNLEKHGCKEHDGLMPVENQLDERIGTDLGIIYGVDHLYITNFSITNDSEKKAGIIYNIFDSVDRMINK
jgi:pimeloyl-ACP methyl ester carboxylesterase